MSNLKKLPESLEEVLSGNFIFHEDENLLIKLEINDSGFFIAVYRYNIDHRNPANSKKSFVDSSKPWSNSLSGIEDMAEKMYKKYFDKGPTYFAK